MGSDPDTASGLLARGQAAWASGDGETAMALYARAADLADESDDLDTRVAAVLGLARGQRYNHTPGLLPVRLHSAYDATTATAPKARLASALARCWAYANEPARAQPFAREALEQAAGTGDPALRADALDAALAAHWGPDDLDRRREWARRLDDTVAHLADPEARLQAQLWLLTVAWESLDLPRMHRSMRNIELLADESPRAEFFAATRRVPLELLRGNFDVVPILRQRALTAAERVVIPDSAVMQLGIRGYTAWFAGDSATCAVVAPHFEAHAVDFGITTVRAEAGVIWSGAERPDKVREMLGAFTPDVLDGLPRDSDFLLTLQCVLEGALYVGDRDVAAAAARVLAPYAGRSVVNAGAVGWHGVTDDTLARAAALLGDAESAARLAAGALRTYERIGATWWRDRLRAALPRLAAGETRVVHLHEERGGLWRVGREGAVFVLPRMRGLTHLHQLVSSPGRDLSAAALIGAEGVTQGGLEQLDAEARRAYRARLETLDPETDADERRWLVEQLGAATGLAGRHRVTGSTDERARVAVRKAIVAAMARIAEADPWLGRHLNDRIRTGTVCRYEPDPDRPVRWVT